MTRYAIVTEPTRLAAMPAHTDEGAYTPDFM